MMHDCVSGMCRGPQEDCMRSICRVTRAWKFARGSPEVGIMGDDVMAVARMVPGRGAETTKRAS
jgi:hypothetical protein